MLLFLESQSADPLLCQEPDSFSSEEVKQAGDVIRKLQDGGVPTFIALERGARALKNALDYNS